MTGGLLQLVAYGAQDVYLTGNPQITFFKVVYRRHTNFAMESIVQTFNGSGKRLTAQISRNGDLIHKMYVVMKVGDTAFDASRVGHRLLEKVELEIGGQLIDRQYSNWMYIWNELSLPYGKNSGFASMVGSAGTTEEVSANKKLYVPLEFWFCRNIGLALPLIAMQYHEVKVNIEFSDEYTSLSDRELWVDYIYLDTDERRRFAQLSHEYLIEQIQFTGNESAKSKNEKIKLNFNHPVKELVWVFSDSRSNVTPTHWTEFEEMETAKLQLNGNDRFAERDSMYFSHVQPYQHHENIPDGKNIYMYSFGVKPEEHQPSGTLNMSRIDTATLSVGFKTENDDRQSYVYAVNYNVLRILSGMAGLAYSN
jgi:hypothetical protein